MKQERLTDGLRNRLHKGSPFVQGMRDAVPIGMGYYAVAFSLGIIAANVGIPALLGFTSSLLTRASAGEFGAYMLIAAHATSLEVIGMGIVTNLRYLLMSTALTQKFERRTPLWKRILAGCCMTDEVFGISIAYPHRLPASYPIGATVLAGTMWAAGTASGILAGDILPANVISALSVALYGMFIAIIIPPSRENRVVAVTVAVSFALSGLCTITPWVSQWSSGMRTIVLTVIIATLAAILKPVEPENEADDDL